MLNPHSFVNIGIMNSLTGLSPSLSIHSTRVLPILANYPSRLTPPHACARPCPCPSLKAVLRSRAHTASSQDYAWGRKEFLCSSPNITALHPKLATMTFKTCPLPPPTAAAVKPPRKKRQERGRLALRTEQNINETCSLCVLLVVTIFTI